MKEYNVGQIIYLLSPKTLKVLPALIVEEITRKTVLKSETQFVIEMPDEKKTRVTIDEVKAKIFSDVEKLRIFMIENATNTIDQLIENAIKEKEMNFNQDALSLDLINDNDDQIDMQNSELSVIINNEKDKNTQTLEEK